MVKLGEASPLGKITVVQDYDDKTVTLSGTVGPLFFESDNDFEDIYTGGGSDRFMTSRTVSLRTTFIGECTVKEEKKMKTKPISHTALVEASDHTIKALEAARKLAGAPAGAKFRLLPDVKKRNAEMVLSGIDTPVPVVVEFYWTTKEA